MVQFVFIKIVLAHCDYDILTINSNKVDIDMGQCDHNENFVDKKKKLSYVII